jgi:hypothetical protein
MKSRRVLGETWVCHRTRHRCTVGWHGVVTGSGAHRQDNFEWAPTLVRELGDFAFGRVTVNLDGGHDAIAASINNGVA